MGLHCVRISSLRKDLKQFVIGEEIKARKGASFDFKVVLHLLLNLLELLVVFLEFPEKFL
jgi:hypothetical protein